MQSKLRVFVVDDEPVIAWTVAKILSMNGLSVQSFTKPTEALEAARLQPPHLLLSDILMPELTGVDLAIQVKALCPECKIMLFSGQAGTVNPLADVSKLSGTVVLTKPLHPRELLAAVRQQGFDVTYQMPPV
jgi:DNA-binding NtrC family response regulator